MYLAIDRDWRQPPGWSASLSPGEQAVIVADWRLRQTGSRRG